MDEEFGPCAVVGWCTGHPEWERLDPEDYIHSGEPEVLIECLAEANPDAEDLVIERQLFAARGHESFHLYGNIARTLGVDDLEPMALQFERAAAHLRRLARSNEVENARRLIQ